MTRRRIVVGGALAASAAKSLAQQVIRRMDEMVGPEKDTFVIFIDDGTGGFGVGVRTSIRASQALVAVFYEMTTERYGRLLLSKQSIAPVAGSNGYGVTRENFAIPREKVKFVRVTFLNEVARREVKSK